MDPHNSSSNLQSSDYVFQLAASSGDEGNAGVVFAARASGLLRSRDNGHTWESAYESLRLRQALPTSAVVLSPDFGHDRTVFAGLNGALLRSHDGGGTWQRCRLPSPPPAISALSISPQFGEDESLFAGTNEDGVLKSSDGGRNWVTWNFGLLDLNILCLAVSPEFSKDETLFAGTGSGLFRSTNGGRAWKEVPLPFDFDAVLSLAISPTFARDGTVYAGTENNGLLISIDQGRSWRVLGDDTCREPVNLIAFLPLSSGKQDLIIASGAQPLVSKDHGATWKSWHVSQISGKDVTTLLPGDGSERATLAGFSDGSIRQIR